MSEHEELNKVLNLHLSDLKKLLRNEEYDLARKIISSSRDRLEYLVKTLPLTEKDKEFVEKVKHEQDIILAKCHKAQDTLN